MLHSKLESKVCSCRFSYLRLGKVCGVWRPFVERGVRPLVVVELDPVIDDPFCLEPVSDFVQVDGFLLEGSPEPLDEDVVEITTAPIH